MFDFTAIQDAIIDDLRPTYINNYLILNEINILPKELIKHIMYLSFITNDEIMMFKEDITNLEKKCLFYLIYTCCNPIKINISPDDNVNILSPEYNKYLNFNLDNLLSKPLGKLHDKYVSSVTKCVKQLYSLNDDIFDILFKRYCDQKDSTKYIKEYKRDIKFYANTMKISRKYSSLLTIKIF